MHLICKMGPQKCYVFFVTPFLCLSHQVAHTGLVVWPGMLVSFLQMMLAESRWLKWRTVGHRVLIVSCSQCHNGECLRLKRKGRYGDCGVPWSCVISSVNTNPISFLLFILKSCLPCSNCCCTDCVASSFKVLLFEIFWSLSAILRKRCGVY